MCSGNRNALATFTEPPKDSSAFHHRETPLYGCTNFWLTCRNRGTEYEERGIVNMRGMMLEFNLNPFSLQTVELRRSGTITSRDGIAKGTEHASKAAHPCSADADKMHMRWRRQRTPITSG
jgi:hypothetical protein